MMSIYCKSKQNEAAGMLMPLPHLPGLSKKAPGILVPFTATSGIYTHFPFTILVFPAGPVASIPPGIPELLCVCPTCPP